MEVWERVPWCSKSFSPRRGREIWEFVDLRSSVRMGIWGSGGGVLPTGKGWKGNGNLGAHPKDRRLRYQGRKLQSLRPCPPCSGSDDMYLLKLDVGFCTYLPNGTLSKAWNFGSAPLEGALSMPLQPHGLGRSIALWRALGMDCTPYPGSCCLHAFLTPHIQL